MFLPGRGTTSSKSIQISFVQDSQPLPFGMADMGSMGGGVQRNTLPFKNAQVDGTTKPSASLISEGVTFAIRIGTDSSSKMLDRALP